MTEWVAGEAIADAVNFANDFRRKFGIEPLTDLPASIPNEAQECVLARAFNFDCEVDAKSSDQWQVNFRSYSEEENEEIVKKAKALGEILKTEPNFTYKYDEWNGYEKVTASVPLPFNIGQIALAFDAMELDEKYYEEGTI